MDAVPIFKQKLTAAIAELPENTPAARLALYQKTRAFIIFSKFSQLGTALEEAIADIEKGFIPAPQPVAGMFQTAKLLDRFARPSRRVVLTGAVAVAVLVGAAALMTSWVVQSGSGDMEFDRGLAGYSSSSNSFESIPLWSTYYRAKTEEGVTLVEATGPVPLYSNEIIPVTPGQSYKVSTRVRVIADDPDKQGGLMSVGLMALDLNGNTIGVDFLTAHYGAMDGKLVKAADGWTTGEGIMSWNSPTEATLLPPGTKSIRLVARLNLDSPRAISQIDYIRFEPVLGK